MQALETFIKITQALLTPLIAVIATYIAYQQLRANRQKVTLDRYDRRLAVYDEVLRFLRSVLRKGYPTYDELLNFRVSVAQADFLFGDDIIQMIDEMYRRGDQLATWEKQCKLFTSGQPPQGYDHFFVTEAMRVERKWFTDQFDEARRKFRPYLDVSHH